MLKSVKERALAAGAVSLLALSWTCPVFAQDAAAPQAADDAASDNSEILVTARKRTERLIDVPAAITALNTEALSRYDTTSMERLATQIPQIQITRAGSGSGAQVTIRGIGSNASSDDSIEQSVAFNIDGVPTSRGRSIQQGLFDLASVQVLKGPQALYFGKNSPAGVIVLESRGPGDSLNGYIKAGYEIKAAEYVAEGAIGGPLTDTLGIRLAVRGSDMTKGYVHNVARGYTAAASPIAFDRNRGLVIPGRDFKWGPNTKQLAGRFTAVWKPTPDFDATLKVFESYSKDQGDSSQTVVIRCSPGQSFVSTTDLSASAFPGSPSTALDLSQPCDGVHRDNSFARPPAEQLNGFAPGFKRDASLSEVRAHLASLQMNYRTGDITLTSVTGFYQFRADAASDGANSGLAIIVSGGKEKSKSFSQELRLTTAFSSPFNFTLGGFYSKDDRTIRVFSTLLRNIDPATGYSVTAFGRGGVDGETMSAFGEVTWKVTPELELAGGARYTHEKKDGFVQSDYLAPGVATALRLSLPTGTRIPASIRENNVSPQATLSWHPIPNATLYAGYRTGYKAGTISNPALICACSTSATIKLKNEKARGYEGGVKYESEDRRLTGEVSIYHYLFKNLQVQAFDTQVNAVISKNAGAAQIDGIEISGTFRATDELTLRGSGSYNRARYASFVGASCYTGQTAVLGCVASTQNLTGRQLPRAPDYAGTAGFSYDMPVSNDWTLGFTADGRYTASYFVSPTNSPFARQKSYISIDASLRLYDGDDRWSFSVIGRNLTNKLYYDFASDRPFAAGSVRASLGAPRTVMLQAGYNF